MTFESFNKCEEVKYAQKLLDFASSFLNAHQLQNIWVSRFYFDGRYSSPGTDVLWNKRMYDLRWHQAGIDLMLKSVTQPGQNDNCFYYWSADATDAPTPLQELRKHNGARSGYNYIIRRDDHVETIGFSSQLQLHALQTNVNFHMSEHLLFLFNIIEAHRKWDPPIYRTYSETWNSYEIKKPELPDRLSVTLFNQTRTLSKTQIHILYLLSQRKIAKVIAPECGLSSRTVEFHISAMRNLWDDRSTSLMIEEFQHLQYPMFFAPFFSK